MASTLVLNADGTPVNLIPMSVLSWQDAVGVMWTGEAEPLHFYDNWSVHSPSVEMQIPTVCILKRQVTVRRSSRADTGGPARKLVFLRDGFRCQYCAKIFAPKDLTLDHVVPRKNGGKTKWDNIASACGPCNGRRGHNTKIQPINRPYRPTYYQLVKMMRKFPINIPHETWNYYLGWDESLVRITSPQQNNSCFSEDNFDFPLMHPLC